MPPLAFNFSFGEFAIGLGMRYYS